MKRSLFSLLLALLMLLLSVPALSEEEEEPSEPVVPPVVAFRSDFYIGYLDKEIDIPVYCKNKDTVTVPEKYLELRNQRGEVLERAFWRNPKRELVFSVYVTEEMLGGNRLSVWLNGEKVSEADTYAAFSDKDLPRVSRLTPSEPAVSPMIVCSGATERQVTAMLDTLAQHGAKATFFLTGDFLNNTPELAQRIVDAGHEIASHGMNLVDMTMVTSERARRNIRDFNQLCEEVLGIRPRLFCGHRANSNSAVTAIIRAEGMEDCMFAVDAFDWSEDYRDKFGQMVYRVTSDRVSSGCLVQFHINGYRSAEVLDKALDNWVNVRGYKVVSVSELMALSGRELPPLPDAEQ